MWIKLGRFRRTVQINTPIELSFEQCDVHGENELILPPISLRVNGSRLSSLYCYRPNYRPIRIGFTTTVTYARRSVSYTRYHVDLFQFWYKSQPLLALLKIGHKAISVIVVSCYKTLAQSSCRS
jgi:hypothetical protein